MSAELRINEPYDGSRRNGKTPPAQGRPALEAVHIRKVFPLRALGFLGPERSVHAVEDTSLALYPGRATALVGESGSGKTTVARMLARLYEPTSGNILLEGRPIGDKDALALHEYRRQVQMVFQDPFSSLNPVHDVYYHLSRPLAIYGGAKGSRQLTEQCLALL